MPPSARRRGGHSVEPTAPRVGLRPQQIVSLLDRHAVNVLLVGQTLPQVRVITGGVPTRPSQNSPERVAKWQQARAVVGSSIRTLRLAKGMTQEALALRSGVTRNVLIDVEHGKRGLLFERLVDIAEALEVEPGALFNGSAAVSI